MRGKGNRDDVSDTRRTGKSAQLILSNAVFIYLSFFFYFFSILQYVQKIHKFFFENIKKGLIDEVKSPANQQPAKKKRKENKISRYELDKEKKNDESKENK